MPWTNVSIVLNSRDRSNPTNENYNNANYNSTNQNIVQGQIHSVSVNEVNFPYDIPNMQKGYNEFLIDTVVGSVFLGNNNVVSVVPGFYTGTELAAAINASITAIGAAAAVPLVPNDMPTCVYDATTNLFRFEPPTAPSQPQYTEWFFASPYTYPNGLVGIPKTLGKDIMSIMGFLPSQIPRVDSNGPIVFTAGSSAPLVFTQYVDICSSQLCKFQFFRDGSTTNLARRSDVICRLYVSNNVATQEEEGLRPFVIHRQFNNARVMRWTADNSVGQIDIQLYDDVGQPLQTSWQPRPYQITFNVYEQDKDSTTY